MSPMRRWRNRLAPFLFVLALYVPLLNSLTSAQKPGDAPPPEVQARLKQVGKELDEALRAKNEPAVHEAVRRARGVLGSYAGVPESPEEYVTPINPGKPDPDQLGTWLQEALKQSLPVLGSKNPEAPNNRIELREAAYAAILCLTMADLLPGQAQTYRQRALEELDYLLERQHPSGMFPYPANPGSGAPPNVRAAVEKMRQAYPDNIWKGYMALLSDTGNQFDTGCCSYALLCGYEATRNSKYLEAAKKAGEWAMTLPMATNWNYNAFSVWHLAGLHRLTGESKYLESAVEKATLGVLPGLMENGRWVDQHNAKASYHFIMVRALSELMRTLPENHKRYAEIRGKTILAAESRAREILDRGPSNAESALWGLVAFQEALGPNEICARAANATVNASLARGTLTTIATPLYLRFMKRSGGFSGPKSAAQAAPAPPTPSLPASSTPTREELLLRHEAIRRSSGLITDPEERARLTEEIAKARARFEQGDYAGAGRHLSIVEAAIAKKQGKPEIPSGAADPAALKLLDSESWRGRMPAERQEAIKPLMPKLAKAMNAEDRTTVATTVAEIIKLHAEYAGVPEDKPEYGRPINAAEPDLNQIEGLWRASFLRMKGRNAFERAPAADAPEQTGERLRTSLRSCRAYLQSYDAGLEGREDYLATAKRGFEYLLQTQASTGVFGYPYDPAGSGLKKNAAEVVSRGQAQGLKMVEKGWVIEDLGDGGLQFDNGEVGTGLLYAYALNRDNRYLAAARRAAEWAAGRPLVLNWNYNSFSGLLLSRMYRVTGEKKFLEQARKKFDFGVLPGQMDSGRWFDQHNAKIQYHSVMLRALVEYYLALVEAQDPAADRVKDHTVRGLDSLAAQITTYGASNAPELLSTDALCLGLLAFGPRPAWQKALNVNIHYLCDVFLPQLVERGYPMTETGAHYLLYRRVISGKAKATEIQMQPKGGRAATKPARVELSTGIQLEIV